MHLSSTGILFNRNRLTDTSGNAYAGINDTTTLSFTSADTAAPTLTRSNPADNAVNVAVASNLVLTFSEAVAQGTGNITLFRADGTEVESFNVATSTRLTFSGQTLTIDPTSDLTSGTDYYLRIASGAVRDLTGNNYAGVNDNTSFSFTTADVIAPTLASTSPSDDAINVGVDGNLVLTFSEAIARGTGSIVLYDSNGNAVETFNAANSDRLSFNGQTLTIDPTVNLDSSTGYYLEIANGVVKDLAGNNFAGINNATTLNFTTAAALDTTAPTLTSSNPTDEATNFTRNNSLVFTFSERIKAGTGNITLYRADNTVVETFAAASNRLSFSGQTLTIDPTADLDSNTGYYLQIANGAVKDLADNNYAGINNTTTTLSFTTATELDTSPPTLVISNPADGAPNVALNSNLVFTFSEAIAKGTGNISLYKADDTVAETFNAATSNRLSFSGQNLTINPTADLDSNTSYYLQIDDGAVKDLAGNNYAGINDDETLNFTTADIAAPTLISGNPNDNAINVAVADNLVLTFSENIQAGTGDLVLYTADGTEVERFAASSTRLSFSGQTLSIDPTDNLASGTSYYLQIANGAVKDLAGNNYTGISDNTTLNFTSTDTLAPTLTSSNPSDNTNNVAVDSSLILTFSEAIAKGTGNITLYNSADTAVENFDVATSTRLTFSGSTLTIDPSADLTSSTGYYLQIANGAVTDASGNAYAGINDNTTLNFTSADVVAPTLTSSNPADNANNVVVESNLTLTFSEAIARGTGNITLHRSDDGTEFETFDAATSNRLNFSGQTLSIDPSIN